MIGFFLLATVVPELLSCLYMMPYGEIHRSLSNSMQQNISEDPGSMLSSNVLLQNISF